MTLDALLELVSGSPYRLNNLCELEDGTWRANLTERDTCELNDQGQKIEKRKVWAEFGNGPTPADALVAVMVKAGYVP